MFLVREEGRRGIYSGVYITQVLDSVIGPFYDSLTPEQQAELIFIEDRAKVYKGKARL